MVGVPDHSMIMAMFILYITWLFEQVMGIFISRVIITFL